MDTYKEITQYNGDILLKKYTIDTMGYDIVNMNNGDILLRKIKAIRPGSRRFGMPVSGPAASLLIRDTGC